MALTATAEGLLQAIRTQLEASIAGIHVTEQIDVVTQDPTSLAHKGTALLRVVLDNPEARLQPGMSAIIELLLRDVELPAVPLDALLRHPSGDGKAVFLISKQRTLELRPVTEGRSDGAFVSIRAGLDTGDLVVRSPSAQLQAGAVVELASSEGAGR